MSCSWTTCPTSQLLSKITLWNHSWFPKPSLLLSHSVDSNLLAIFQSKILACSTPWSQISWPDMLYVFLWGRSPKLPCLEAWSTCLSCINSSTLACKRLDLTRLGLSHQTKDQKLFTFVNPRWSTPKPWWSTSYLGNRSCKLTISPFWWWQTKLPNIHKG